MTMTVNGITTTKTPGQEQYETFKSRVNKKTYVQYDYRHTNGKLFSCVKPTLEECRAARDEWERDIIGIKIKSKDELKEDYKLFGGERVNPGRYDD